MELCEDEFIVPAESAAHAWMDRFIKLYEYGIDESVTVKNGKITWLDIWREHSIYLNKDRFIIDGDEIFINAELWKKYLRMRELCGAIYVRAPRKIAFPYDWSELSDDEVLEKIQYLEKNYKKYNITIIEGTSVAIDNVVIRRETKKVDGRDKTCFTINNKTYCREHSIGKELIELVHLCKMYKIPSKVKIKNWWQDKKYLFGAGATAALICVGIGGLLVYAYKDNKKTQKQFKQQVVKETVNSLQKQQQKMMNYNDFMKVR